MPTIKRLAPVLTLVLLANFAVWLLVNPSVSERSFGGIINCLSYGASHQDLDPEAPSDEAIQKDLTTLTDHTSTIRLYGADKSADRIIAEAARHGINVLLGAWISADEAHNAEEVAHAIDLVHSYPNITRLVIGNEALLRGEITPQALIALIERCKRQVNIPVSTAEPWHIWIDYPELADSVDFITVHVLPYWEGIPIQGAIGYTIFRYRQLQVAFPRKHILLGEVGWPSEGQWVKGSEPSQINQAKYIRDFLNVANEQRLDYSIVEAFDEPWKRKIEGSVGAHWGLWDVDRHPKFSMSGSVTESTRWIQGCLIASLLAFFPIQWFVRRKPGLKLRGQIFYAGLIQAVASVFVWAIMAALAEKIINGNTLAWIALISAQIVLLALLLVDGFELTEVLWAIDRHRKFEPHKDWQPTANAPMVSIHVPCYNEPPAMVLETLDALARLDYPNFEVLVIDNNTPFEHIWRPVLEHCQRLGPRFRFFHLPSWPGFKAGALNFALKETHPDAAIVGVIDSDYVVSPDWLRGTVPYFERREVGFVQAPQDYRDGDQDAFKRMCYWEYAASFISVWCNVMSVTPSFSTGP